MTLAHLSELIIDHERSWETWRASTWFSDTFTVFVSLSGAVLQFLSAATWYVIVEHVHFGFTGRLTFSDSFESWTELLLNRSFDSCFRTPVDDYNWIYAGASEASWQDYIDLYLIIDWNMNSSIITCIHTWSIFLRLRWKRWWMYLDEHTVVAVQRDSVTCMIRRVEANRHQVKLIFIIISVERYWQSRRTFVRDFWNVSVLKLDWNLTCLFDQSTTGCQV